MLEPAASKVADSTASDHSGAPPESLVEAEQPAAGQGALVDHKREWATLAVQLAAATPASFHRAIAGQAVALGRLAQAPTDWTRVVGRSRESHAAVSAVDLVICTSRSYIPLICKFAADDGA